MPRQWIEQTHSRRFELCRHFFLRFFDSELISDPTQAKVLAGGAIGILSSLGLLFGQAFYHKYLMLMKLDSPEPFAKAVRGDVMMLVTFAMTASALFTTLQWPALFPSLRDYLALAALPVRMREIFVAKFTALVGVALATIAAVSLPPSVLIPGMMAGPYAAGYVWHVPGIFAASMLGGSFVFFALVTLQGVLLNLLPVRHFPRISLALQGVLLAILLGSFPFIFSIPSFYERASRLPPWSIYAPPVWFFGVDQIIFGANDPGSMRLAHIALIAVPVAAVTAIATYLWSYRRHRVRVLEAPSADSARRFVWSTGLFARWLAEPRSIGVFAFIATSLARSRQHRLVLTALLAIAIAVITEGFAGLALDGRAAAEPLRETVIAIPLTLSLFLLAGLRYLFRLPVELRANWIFRITEPGHATALAEGIERFLFCFGALPVAIAALPAETILLGPIAGVLVCALCFAISLGLIECLLFTFDRIPFTSSYFPGQRPLIETLLKYSMLAAGYIWGLAALISFVVRSIPLALVSAAILFASTQALRRVRLSNYPVMRFEFEEGRDPVVQGLGIERE